jgi:hypothetical protein
LPIATPGSAVATGVDPKLESSSRDRWFNTCTVTLTGVRQNCASTSEEPAFLIQAPFTLRTLSVRFPNIRTKRTPTVDFSLFKQFPIKERMRLPAPASRRRISV